MQRRAHLTNDAHKERAAASAVVWRLRQVNMVQNDNIPDPWILACVAVEELGPPNAEENLGSSQGGGVEQEQNATMEIPVNTGT